MSITVTATPTGAAGATLRVLVLTGAVESGGASVGPAGSVNPGSTSLTPNFSHSFVAWALNDAGSNTAFTNITNNSLLDNIATTGGQRMGTGEYTGTTTASTAITVGAAGGSNPTTLAAYEIPPSVAGVTPVVDASSPAVVDITSGSTALTTAAFTPPGGSVVVAIVTGAAFPTAWTVTDSSSMAWTKRIDNGNGQRVYTATVASGGTAWTSGVSQTITETTTAAAALAATAGASLSATESTTAAATLAAVAAASLSATAAISADVTKGSGGTGWTTGVAATETATITPAASMAGVAGTSLPVAATITAAASVTGPGQFPSAPLGVEVDLNLTNAGWTNISPYVKLDNAAGVTITRGRADGSQTVNPSTAGMTWSNLDGRFSPRNPLGPYYGQLGRNTPVRVSIPAQSTYLRIADDRTSQCFAPDSLALSVTGDLDIQIDLSLTNWTFTALCSKWNPTGSQQSWLFNLEPSGVLRFFWSNNGTTLHSVDSTIPIPVVSRIALRATLSVATGTVTYYTAPTIAGPWTQLGAPGTGTSGASSSVFDSTASVVVGDNTSAAQGMIYAFKYLNGIGGTVVASPDFTTATAGAASMTDAQGNVWTVGGTAEFSARNYRFHGECAALPQTWNRDDVWTPVSAAGVLRRINTSNDTLQSPMYRGYTQLTGSLTPIAYWPAEDGSNAEQIAAAIGGRPMQVNGPAQFAANSDFLCSQPIPVVNNSSWTGFVPKYTTGTDIIYRFLMEVPAAGETDGDRIARIHASGTVRTMTLFWKSGGNLEVIGYDNSGNVLFDSGSVVFGVNGELLRVSMELRQNGGNINWSVVTLQPGASSGSSMSGTIAGTVGNALKVYISPDGSLTGTACGHMSVQSTWDSLFDLGAQLNAFQGETAGSRFARLCTEEGVNYRIYGIPSQSVMMGAQQIDALANLLQECEDADRGMIFEPMDTLGLGYRTSGSMCAQSAGVALDYSLDHLSPPLSPTDDDQYTQNDITVSAADGSSARAILNDGSPMSISDPPVGVGSYVFTNTVYVLNPSQLNDIANWLLHLGTVNEERYPEMMVDLAATSTAIQNLFYPVLGVRLGDMVTVANVPYFLPPDGIKAIVWGDTEVLGDFVCNTTWQTQPESPYEVLIAGTGAITDDRADTDGSSLHANITSAATSFQVDTAAGNAIWTTAAGDFPFDIIVGGERMTVTNITGSSSPQTFTVTRSVNGVVKAHNAADSVALFSPCYVALA